jgi:Kef-type K+ transport system membrane component KefB
VSVARKESPVQSETAAVLLSLVVVLVVAKAGGSLFRRLGQPPVVGELLAGVIAGPAMLGWFHVSVPMELVATLGVIVLMFAVGLETKASDLFRVGRTALLVATLGVVVPFAAGWAFGAASGLPVAEALFVGTALVATSVGVTARVLTDRGLITTRTARVILAAAVIDDVLGMLVLSVVVGATRSAFDPLHLALVVGQILVFIGFELLVAPRLLASHGHHLDRVPWEHAPFAFALLVMLAMAATAEAIGLAGIVGAFFAGMMFAETHDRWSIDEKIRSLYAWLVPVFFAVTGARLDVGVLIRPEVLLPGLLLTAIAIATKVVGCGIGALGEGRKAALAVGIGMVPRGEVGLIVASVGLAAKVVSPAVYGMVVLVVIVSTLVVPPVLPRLFATLRSDEQTG